MNSSHHHRTNYRPPPDHHRTITTGPSTDHQWTTAGTPPDHRRTIEDVRPPPPSDSLAQTSRSFRARLEGTAAADGLLKRPTASRDRPPGELWTLELPLTGHSVRTSPVEYAVKDTGTWSVWYERLDGLWYARYEFSAGPDGNTRRIVA